MSLIPNQDHRNITGGPANETGHLWFLRACVGLSFTLWSAATSQPLAKISNGWGTLPTSLVYPLASAPPPSSSAEAIPHDMWVWASWFVCGTFVAIIAAGVAVGTLASHDRSTRGFGDNLQWLVKLWCFLGGGLSLGVVFDPPEGANTTTPLAGMLLIWLSLAVLLIPGCTNFDEVNPLPEPPAPTTD